MRKGKGFKTYKRLGVSLFSLVCISAGIATASFSYSWFTNKNNVTKNITGKTAGAYFGGGDGSKDNAFIISKPIHLYNLAWLYYIGYFEDKEPYFKITSDLDMSNWYLPPIGTSTHHFNGHLDGNNKTISNLKVSNSFDELKSKKPSSVSEDDWNGTTNKYGPTPNILGLFGYISKSNSTSGVPSVENVRINNETVNSVTSTALTGIVAGYVDGKLDGIYLDNSSVNLNAKSADGTAIDTKPLGTLGNETISDISAYTSVGYCTDAYKTSYTKYETTLYEPKQVDTSTFSIGEDSGGDGGWGGSIDMRTLNRRLNYIMGSDKKVSTDTYGYIVTNRTDIKLNASFSTTYGSFYWDAESLEHTLYMYDGTCLPLNVDSASMGLDSEAEITVTSLSKNLYTNEQYKNATSETISSKNTGYFVSCGTDRASSFPTGSAIRSGIRTFAEGTYYSGIPDSFKDVSAIDVYDQNQFAMYTIKKENNSYNTYRIIDDVNGNNYDLSDSSNKSYTDLGLVKYKGVRTNFDTTMEGSKVYHGFHFMKAIPSDLSTLNNLEYDYTYSKWGTQYTVHINLIDTEDVEILGNKYQNYELIKGGLNFTVEKDGYITAILGQGYRKGAHSLFDLYKIERDQNHKITSLTRIKQVYLSKDGSMVSYNEVPASGYSSMIDIAELASTNDYLEKYGAYYFEIPVSSGDYLIAADKSSSENNAYLMYLDIGANGNEGESKQTITRTKVFELLEQITQAFTYPTGVYVADFENAALDIEKQTQILCITLGSKYSGEAKITRTEDTASLTVATSTENNTGVAYYDSDLTLKNNEKALSDDDYVETDQVVTKTKRLTYYDYNSTTTTLTMFRFSQTSTNGGDNYGELTAETQYQAAYVDSKLVDWEEPEKEQTVYTDEGKEGGTPTSIDDQTINDKIFTLALKDNAKDKTITNTYLPQVSLGTDKVTSPTGYVFAIEKDATAISKNDYNLTRNNANYYLKINADEYAATAA